MISPSNHTKNLGVVFDQVMSMEKQISNVCRTCIFHLRNIGSVRDLLTDNAAAQLVHSLVTSRLDYCNSLLYGLPDNKIKRLQRVQNIAARIVSCSPKANHITPVLRNLHWLPIRQCILFKVLLLAFKAYKQIAPEYLCNLIRLYEPSRSLHSSHQLMLVTPRTRLKTYGDRAFCSAAPREWNNLPLTIRSCTSLDCFKSALKTYLFKKAYDS